MRPEVHIAILKTLEKTKPELAPETTFPVSEVIQLDVNGTVQTASGGESRPPFRPPFETAFAILISDMDSDEQTDVLDSFERAMKKVIRIGDTDKVAAQYGDGSKLVAARVDRARLFYEEKTPKVPVRARTTVAVEVKEISV